MKSFTEQGPDVEEKDVTLECGTTIINVFANWNLSVEQMLAEFIDNSFGAGATRVLAKRSPRSLTISDNGSGCPDLTAMLSLAASSKHIGDRAGRYGVGGTMSQIRASRRGVSSVTTIRGDTKSLMVVDWSKCADSGIFKPERFRVGLPVEPGEIGTEIVLTPCVEIRKADELATRLGFSYSKALREGREIVLVINGREFKVVPYSPPQPVRGMKIKLDFELRGFRIKGFCMLVKDRKENRHPGFSVHFGYRHIGVFENPCDGKRADLLYAEIYLPSDWDSLATTKDGFENEPEDLWLALAEKCQRIIDAAHEGQQDSQEDATTEAVEEILGHALLSKGRPKGARPGSAGKSGAAKPTGTGGPHENFDNPQPTDEDGSEPESRYEPNRVRVRWAEIDQPCEIKAIGINGKVLLITFNSTEPQIAALRDYPEQQATACLFLLATWIQTKSEAAQRLFPSICELKYQDVIAKLIERVRRSRSREYA